MEMMPAAGPGQHLERQLGRHLLVLRDRLLRRGLQLRTAPDARHRPHAAPRQGAPGPSTARPPRRVGGRGATPSVIN